MLVLFFAVLTICQLCITYDTGFFLGKAINFGKISYLIEKLIDEHDTQYANFVVKRVDMDTHLMMTVSTKPVQKLPNAVVVLQHLERNAGGKGKLLGHGVPYLERYLSCGVHYVLCIRRSETWTHLTSQPPSDGATFRREVAAFYQLFDVLQYIHGKGVVHRNLCEENILIGTDHKVYLIGFDHATTYEKKDRRYSFGKTYDWKHPKINPNGVNPNRAGDMKQLGEMIKRRVHLCGQLPDEFMIHIKTLNDPTDEPNYVLLKSIFGRCLARLAALSSP